MDTSQTGGRRPGVSRRIVLTAAVAVPLVAGLPAAATAAPHRSAVRAEPIECLADLHVQ
jgi:hypothetical protein